jgi:hypothetical protein
MRVRSRRLAAQRRNKAALLLAAVATAACPLSSRGASDSWVGSTFGSDNWSTPTNWSLGHQPGNLDEAFLSGSSFQGTSVIYDASATATNLSSLTLDSAALRPITLFQATNTLTTAVEYVGSNRTGNLNISGGTHTVNGSLIFGNSVGASGNGSLSGGTLNTLATYVGNAGAGFFNQTGGSYMTSELELATAAGSSGTYNLSNGASLNTNEEDVGFGGTGVFNQSGGSNTALGVSLGNVLGSSGTYNLSNGASLNVSAGENIGTHGTGVFNQTGGSHNVSAAHGVIIGFSPDGSGTYTLSAGTLMVPNGPMYVGYSGTGVFNQTGGSNIVNGTNGLYLGSSAGSSGTYTLSGGTLSVTNGVFVSEYIGYAGTGVFNQAGGSNSTFRLDVAYSASASGTCTLAGGMLSSQHTVVGVSGTGVFIQTGGSHIAADMELGLAAGGSGTYNLNNGSFASSNEEDVGSEGNGVF